MAARLTRFNGNRVAVIDVFKTTDAHTRTYIYTRADLSDECFGRRFPSTKTYYLTKMYNLEIDCCLYTRR